MRNGCSDRLCHVQDKNPDMPFHEIMELYRGQISEELGPPFDDDAQTEKCANEMNEAADLAEEIYNQHNDDQAAAEAMQESENAYVVDIGEALESGDWAPLAI